MTRQTCLSRNCTTGQEEVNRPGGPIIAVPFGWRPVSALTTDATRPRVGNALRVRPDAGAAPGPGVRWHRSWRSEGGPGPRACAHARFSRGAQNSPDLQHSPTTRPRSRPLAPARFVPEWGITPAPPAFYVGDLGREGPRRGNKCRIVGHLSGPETPRIVRGVFRARSHDATERTVARCDRCSHPGVFDAGRAQAGALRLAFMVSWNRITKIGPRAFRRGIGWFLRPPVRGREGRSPPTGRARRAHQHRPCVRPRSPT